MSAIVVGWWYVMGHSPNRDQYFVILTRSAQQEIIIQINRDITLVHLLPVHQSGFRVIILRDEDGAADGFAGAGRNGAAGRRPLCTGSH